MIAAAEQPDDRKPGGDRRKPTAGPDTPEVPPPSVRYAELPTLADGRIRSNAIRLTKLAEAGSLAADSLLKVQDWIKKILNGKKRPSLRELDRIGRLQAIIATLPDKEQTPQQHLHLHGGGAAGGSTGAIDEQGNPIPPQALIEDAEYIEFIAGRSAPDHVQPGGVGGVGDGWKMGSLSAPSVTKPPANGSGGGSAEGSR